MKTESIRASGTFWAWVPALLLGSMLSGLGTLAYIALDDPHFALEPNYYDKAVHWDSARAAAQRSRETGFSVELAPLVEHGGVVSIVLELRDRQQHPVAGAELLLEAFPNAYASRVERLRLREVSPGTYAGELRGAVPGLWELRLTATSATTHFEQVVRSDVSKGGAA